MPLPHQLVFRTGEITLQELREAFAAARLRDPERLAREPGPDKQEPPEIRVSRGSTDECSAQEHPWSLGPE